MVSLSNGGMGDLSKKQAEMALARSPMNDQEINLQSMKKKKEPQGVLTPQQQQQQQQQQAGVQTQQGVTGQTAAAATPYQGLAQELGSFSDRINAMTAAFLGSGAADISAQVAEGFAPEYQDGEWVPGAMDQPLDIEAGAMSEAKARRLGELREELSPYMVDGRFQQFEDVIEQFGDTDGDGVLSADEQASVNEAFSIVNQIRRLRELPAGPEREALMMQLQAQDQDGLVTGIMEAMEQYESIARGGEGYTISGAGEEEFSISDVLDMGTEDLVEEIKRAAVGRESLFGDTMGADLRKQVDLSADRYRTASKERAQAMSTIQQAADQWIGGIEDQLEDQRDEINETFLSGVQGIVSDLDAIAEAEDNPEWVERAKQWFIDTAEGSAEEGTDFASKLMDMVTGDSGLAPEVQSIFQQYLDDALGGEPGQAGLAVMLSGLAEKGYLEMPTEEGNMERVPLTANDYLEISRITESDMSAADKQAAIRGLLKERMGAFGKELAENTETIDGMLEAGEIEGAMGLFRKSLVNSLQTYKGSFVDELYQSASETGAQPDQIAGAMQDEVNDYKENIEIQSEKATNRLRKIETDAARDLTEIDSFVKKVRENMAAGADILKGNYQNAIAESVPQYKEAVRKYLMTAGREYDENTVTRYAELYSFLRVMNSLKRRGGGPGGEIYDQVRSYIDKQKPSVWWKTVYDGKANINSLDKLIDNPVQILKYGPTQLTALRKAMSSPNFASAFNDTEAYRSMEDLEQGLLSSRKEAVEAIANSEATLGKIRRMVKSAQSNIDSFSQTLAQDIFDAAKEGETVELEEAAEITPDQFGREAGNILWVEDPTTQGDIDAATPTGEEGADWVNPEDRAGVDEIIDATSKEEPEARKQAATAMHGRAAEEIAANLNESAPEGVVYVAEYNPDTHRYTVTNTATGASTFVNPNPYIDIVTSGDDVENLRNYVNLLQRTDLNNRSWWDALKDNLNMAAAEVNAYLGGEPGTVRDPYVGPYEGAYYDRIIGKGRGKMMAEKLDEIFKKSTKIDEEFMNSIDLKNPLGYLTESEMNTLAGRSYASSGGPSSANSALAKREAKEAAKSETARKLERQTSPGMTLPA